MIKPRQGPSGPQWASAGHSGPQWTSVGHSGHRGGSVASVGLLAVYPGPLHPLADCRLRGPEAACKGRVRAAGIFVFMT